MTVNKATRGYRNVEPEQRDGMRPAYPTGVGIVKLIHRDNPGVHKDVTALMVRLPDDHDREVLVALDTDDIEALVAMNRELRKGQLQ